MKPRGVVACGHKKTAAAAKHVLREGGNAFDAVVAGYFSACVTEPVLASLGGGGFLLARTATGRDIVYDFFAQTPRQQRASDDLNFYPISADFGTAQQEFHIGLGAIATPGAVKGMFAIYRDLCTLPMERLMEPAIHAARSGVEVNAFQAYILDIVNPIFAATRASRTIFGSKQKKNGLVRKGEVLHQPQLADTLESLARESDALFYQGDIARKIIQMCAEGGGHLTTADLAVYAVIKRAPLALNYRGSRVLTNPPPSSGGILIAFALKLLEELTPTTYDFGTARHLELMASIMELTNQARVDSRLNAPSRAGLEHMLDPDYLDTYKQQIRGRPPCTRGTTHISVMDDAGNIASLSVTNGEGCGHIVPNTGIMLNNMLGEKDLNPQGFHRWPAAQRMTSMMAPSLVFLPEGHSIALGSGGSNRLRTAILQVLVNLIDFDMSLEDAVTCPRIHYEGDLLNIEDGFDPEEIKKLISIFPGYMRWETRNLFFGGVHSVMRDTGGFTGVGDPRRGGVAVTVS